MRVHARGQRQKGGEEKMIETIIVVVAVVCILIDVLDYPKLRRD